VEVGPVLDGAIDDGHADLRDGAGRKTTARPAFDLLLNNIAFNPVK
jgi:hypothetical protein